MCKPTHLRLSDQCQPADPARTAIKLCGMSRLADIEAVNQARPDLCGFIVDFPQSHRNVSWQTAEDLARHLEEGITPVAVTVNAPVSHLAACARRGVITTFQLHGSEDANYLAVLRASAPEGIRIIQAFKVTCPQDVAHACQSSADLVLLDSGKGSGQTFDWSLAALATRPFLLAGGLGPGNLAQAVASIRPWGVDMSSGIETNKAKDPAKIAAAVREIRSMQ